MLKKNPDSDFSWKSRSMRACIPMRQQPGRCFEVKVTPLGGACPQVIMVPITLQCSPTFRPRSHLPSCPYCSFSHGRGKRSTHASLPNVKNGKEESFLIFLTPGCLHLTSLSKPVNIFSPFPPRNQSLLLMAFCSLGGKKSNESQWPGDIPDGFICFLVPSSPILFLPFSFCWNVWVSFPPIPWFW